MKINWKIRIQNKAFWLGVIPMLCLLVQQIAAVFGIAIDLSVLNTQLVGVVGTVFGILALVGVVADPTTPGVEDSDRAMQYTEPGKF